MGLEDRQGKGMSKKEGKRIGGIAAMQIEREGGGVAAVGRAIKKGKRNWARTRFQCRGER